VPKNPAAKMRPGFDSGEAEKAAMRSAKKPGRKNAAGF
jgi:hypothetical protein